MRPSHPVMKDLAGNVELSVVALSKRTDIAQVQQIKEMLANAEYWLSFDMASFEPLLARTPSPLRELGVAIALRFGDGIDGALQIGDIARGKDMLLPKVPEDMKSGIERAMGTLEHAVAAREKLAVLEEAGFRRYTAGQSLSVHALRAMGKSQINIAGYPDDEKRVEVKLGEEIVLSAVDEKGRPLPVPEIESNLDAPLLSKDDAPNNRRTIVLYVPGEYLVRVPGRATGDRKLIAR